MFNNFETYFYDNIITTYLEYVGEIESGSFGRNNDLRKAIDCSHKLYHLREHLNPKPNYNSIILGCPEYKILQDINNLSKHNAPSRDKPIISNLNQIIQLIIITHFKDEDGEYFDIDKVIKITKNDGTELFLHDILYKVIYFWNNYLNTHGFTTKEFNLKKPNPIGEFKQRTDCKNMGIEIVKGMPFEMHTQFKEWDYKENKPITVDLSNSQVSFTVYKPPILTPHIQIRNDRTGETLEIDINLTKEDSNKFNSLQTNQERLEFLEKLEYFQKEIIDHLKEFKK